MKQVKIRSKDEYTAYIDAGILRDYINLIGDFCQSKRVVIITESKLVSLHLNYLLMALESNGFSSIVYVFSGVEMDKTMETAGNITDFFAQNKVNNADLIVAFGGGIVSDIAGFCASIYLRGVNYAIIPTTLLSMIDACIGGKNGVNNGYAKNQIGTYYQPKLVLCDTTFLETLSESAIRDGFSEAVKYAMIDGSDLYEMMSEQGKACSYELLITQCITAKSHYISLDEYDRGKRMVLNFGHTIGHAIEQFSKYTVSHGRAVSIGMAMVTRAAEYHELTQKGTYKKLVSLLEQFGLETKFDIPLEFLLNSVMFDKKIRGNTLSIILLNEIGSPYIHKIDYTDALNVKQFFKVLY